MTKKTKSPDDQNNNYVGIAIDLIHADKHGFLVIPEEDQEDLLDSLIFMDRNECDTLISTARNATGKPVDEILTDLNKAAQRFGAAVQEKFGRKGEW